MTDELLARLHADFLGDPAPTDVITFPPSAGRAGEICLSVDAALRQSRSGRRRSFSGELALYLIHGWLHLAGHDDRRPADRRAMRRAEGRALRRLRKLEAMPEFRLKGSRHGEAVASKNRL